MSRRRRQSLSPTLFPFLAVLVCTLGTLILLLALVAQNTSDAAQRIAEQPADTPQLQPGQLTVRQVRELVEEEEFRLGELVSFRDAQTGDLEKRRDQLAHVEDHMRRIRERLNQISGAMEQAFSDQQGKTVSAEELEQLRERIADDQRAVRKLQEEVQSKKPRFVIVPHQGPNGTMRRPIYLECTAEGITIWPEKIQIPKWVLENSSVDANPLDDGLRAARYHALQEYGDQVPPYPMLVVRPDGVESYYAARAALQEWDDQFGYELVPSEVELAYPKPDPQMRERMTYAITQASQRVTQHSVARSIYRANQRVAREAGGGGGPLPGRSGSGNSNYGSKATGDRTTGGNQKVPRLSVSQMDREGRQSGFRDHRAYPSYSSVYGNSAAAGTMSSSNTTEVTAEDLKRRLDRPMQESAASLSSAGANDNLDQAARTAIEQIAQQESDRESVYTLPPGGSQDESELGGQFASGDPGQGQATEGSEFFKMPSEGSAASLGNGGSASQPGDASQQAAGSQQSQSQPQSAQSAPQSEAQPPSSTLPPQQSASNWALPAGMANARGLEIIRPISVEIHPDRYVLKAGSGRGINQTFKIDTDGLQDAVIGLASAIHARIKDWGAAAPGARWSPRLSVTVAADAEQRFNEFQYLMKGSGLPIQRSNQVQFNAPVQADSGQQGGLR